MTIASAWEQHLQGPLQARNTSRRSYFFTHPLATSSADVDSPPERFDVIYERVVFGSNTVSTTRPQSTSAIVKIVSAILSLVRYSSFVTAGTDRQWIEACRHLQSDHVESSFVFVMATLPLVEHSLRQMYVSLNECKEDRKSALIAGEYYLTLDVILEAYVPSEFFVPNSPRLIAHDPARIPNRLCEELGPGLMNMMKDMFMYVYGPRLRDRTSHGEFNTFIGHDIKQEPWLEFFSVLILGLLEHSMTAENDICSSEHRAALDVAHACLHNYTSTRFDEWTVARRETMRCFSLFAIYRDLDIWLDASWIEIVPLIKGVSVFSLENLDSRSLPGQLSRAVMAWPIRAPTNPAQAIGSMNNLPAWIIIVQRIQDCISKVTLKMSSLSEQLQKRQLSSRSRKQFEAMKPVMPRLMGMLVSCLCLVEQCVLVGAKKEPTASAIADGLHLLAEGASQEDIQVRSRLTMFVDKFASNFERAKLNLMEPAWDDLAKGIASLEASYVYDV
ncbi:hypothetical protein MVEG_06034 [Podila verticillata NRRL 6337]|nr:hypothetical protein MVEG_06034 [Podila verticillata NRRL 6337]